MRPTLSLYQSLTLVGLMGLLGGCHVLSETCNEPQRYETAQVAPPLKIPEGLAAPNIKNSLVVPDVAGERKVLTKKDACRDAPPVYFDDRPAPAG
jgi:uncharacterized lipoprotein